jgi:hypothetical protein
MKIGVIIMKHVNIYLLYKDESVYVCMSGGLPPDTHNLAP